MTTRSLTRRAGTVVATLALAGLATLPLAGAASAGPPAPTATGPATAATAVSGSAAPTVDDLDCADLTRAQAQALLVADPSDPHRLDRDGDGQACEGSDLASSSGVDQIGAVPGSSVDQIGAVPGSGFDQVGAVPGGGVEAGDGSGGPGAVDPSAFLLAGTGAVLAAGGGVAVWGGRRAARPTASPVLTGQPDGRP